MEPSKALKIRSDIKSFLESEFGYIGLELTDELNLAENVYIDSINTVKTVAFLESNYRISLEPSDLTPKNFYTLKGLTDLVVKKLGG